jgi:primosomal protein N'
MAARSKARKRALEVAADGLVRAKSALAAEAQCTTGVVDGLVSAGALVEVAIPERRYPRPNPAHAKVDFADQQAAAVHAMRAAVDGVEITRYTHPHPSERTDPEKRIAAGPIGMFRHGGGASEYKDIYLEENPKEHGLVTVG